MASLDREIWEKYRAQSQIISLIAGVEQEIDLEQAYSWRIVNWGDTNVQVSVNGAPSSIEITPFNPVEFRCNIYTGFDDVLFVTLLAGVDPNASIYIQRLVPRSDAQPVVQKQ